MFLCVAGQSAAHPHVFVDTEVGFDIDASRLSSLHIVWTYDEFTTLTIFDILELDADGDGVLNKDDLAKVASGETDWPDGYNGDVYLEADQRQVGFGKPTNASAEMHGDKIVVRFDLPLNEPLDLSPGTAVLKFYDPNYYYAYTATGLMNPDTGSCHATIVPFEADAAAAALQNQLAALSREETPEQQNVGQLFADEIVLTCN
ncbi:DUF1007 family protein [Roseovarius spongiae]|uniref:DUF1007 family protein n=1 Tax=Roseovarius spongiae TaxID=2320272 RepID=A0A3A8AWF3_9RHOB|nr:DUF1007 family protein [Roseovarius spongiae]RKF16698.1 DUF1007 family protein [Roseovarius spongiae]